MSQVTQRRPRLWPVACLALFLGVDVPLHAADITPEQRAVTYLSREVPAWHRQNRCFSCHNNADGARALYRARQRGFDVPNESLADTASWLAQSQKWDQDLANAEYKDGRLARLQFAATLAVARQHQGAEFAASLKQAAARLAQDQADDGSWPMVAGVGGPTTYNTPLATHLARQVLAQAGAEAYRDRLRRSQIWLEQQRIENVLNAAVVLWALADVDSAAARAQRLSAIALVQRGEHASGGWGPYLTSAPEPFDTAVVLMALDAAEDESLAPLIARGRQWLIAQQLDDGSWLATTRPPGGESYAQSISTTAWCLQALLATKP